MMERTQDGVTHSTTSTVTVHELDDDEVGILLAGNNSIFDPDLTSHMLNVPTTIDYDISDAESVSTETNHHMQDDNWFPSLSKASWIQDLDKNDLGDDDDDNDTLMTDRTMETLFASDIVEIGDDDNDVTAAATATATGRYERPSKSRRTSNGPTTLDPMGKNHKEGDLVISDRCSSSLEKPSGLVPLDVVYDLLND